MPATYGDGVAAGVNNGIQNGMANILGLLRQGTYRDYAEMEKRKQAMAEGALQADMQPPQALPVKNGGGAAPDSSMAVPANLVSSYSGMGETSPVGGVPNGQPAAPYQGMGEVNPVVGADALATRAMKPAAPPPQAGQAAPSGVDALYVDQLRELSFDHAQQAKQNAILNANDLDMLQKAYHYQTAMNLSKPYLDQWAKALNEVRANPQNPEKWRSVMVLTGEEDPTKAFTLATNEYAKIRQRYDQDSASFAPLNEQLSGRGITQDLYGDEAKYIQFLNQRKFQPHSPGSVRSGASALGKPSPRPSMPNKR